MLIEAKFHGILADWVGTPTASITLPHGANLTDLTAEIGLQCRTNMPVQLWDAERNTFTKKVMAFCEGTALPLDKELEDGEEITFQLMVAGG